MADHHGGVIGDLLRAVRQHFGMDVAFVSEFTGGQRVFRFVDAVEQDLVIVGGGDPLEATYCKHVVDGLLPSLIPDVALNEVAINLGLDAPDGVNSYLGVPITFPDGRIYGTLCCLGTAPPDLGIADLAALQVVADVVAAQLQRVEEQLGDVMRMHGLVANIIDDRLFHPVFQPIVDLGTGAVVGVEALTRFTAEPMQSPDKWFAAAASVGLGTELELATLEGALAQLSNIPARAYLSVNVSPAALAAVTPLLRTVDGPRLVVEVTEHEVVEDYEALMRTTAELRARGVRFAIDDAGAGYSSLSHVLSLLPDIVKLDMTITRGVDDDLARQALARALVEFGGKLGVTIVAEGVETIEELRTLSGIGVSGGQGYFLAHPGPLPLPEEFPVEPGPIATMKTGAAAIHRAFTTSPRPMTVTTVDGRFIEVNEACAQLFDRPASDFPDKFWQELNPNGDVEETARAFSRVISGACDTAVLQTSVTRGDGSELPVELRGRLMRDNQGRPLWFVSELEPVV
jgi:PAS domain S-box-containing protein